MVNIKDYFRFSVGFYVEAAVYRVGYHYYITHL